MFLAELTEVIQNEDDFIESTELACNDENILAYVEEINKTTGEIRLIPVV